MEEKVDSLSNSHIRATTDGVVAINLHWVGSGRDLYKPGQRVSEEEVMGQLSAKGKLKSTFKVFERSLGFLKVGQPTLFQVIPLGDRWFRGKISKISQSLQEQSQRQNKDLYTLKYANVDMEIIDFVPEMKPKMSVVAKVITNQVQNALRLPHNCLDGNQVLLASGKSQEVTLGLGGDHHYEIKQGIGANDSVQCKVGTGTSPSLFNQSASASKKQFFKQVEGTGELRTNNEVFITPTFSSTIKRLIPSGTEVKKGDTVITLDTKEKETSLQAKEIELTQKKVEFETTKLQVEQEVQSLIDEIAQKKLELQIQSKQLAILSTGSVDIERQKVALQEKRAGLEKGFQELNFKIQSSLKEKGYLKSTEFQKSLESLKEAHINREVSQLEKDLKSSPASSNEYMKQKRKVDVLKRSISSKTKQLENKRKIITIDIELSELRMAMAKFEVDILKEDLQNAELKAPKDGVFILGEHWSGGKITEFKTGDEVWNGTLTGRLVEFKDFYILGKLDESTFHLLKENQSVQLNLTGRIDQKFPGVLREIAPIPRGSSIWGYGKPVIDVKIDVGAHSKTFQPGKTVQYEVQVSEPRESISIPFNAVYERDGKYRVYTSPGGSTKEVKLGIRKHSDIEILKGLSGGETVYWDEVQ